MALLVALVALAPAAVARDVRIPIDVDHRFIHRLFVDQIYTDPETTAHVWRDAAGCSEIVLARPRVGSRDGQLNLDTAFDAKLGAGLGNWCLGVTQWQGRIDVLLSPSVHPSAPIVEFRVVDSHLYDSDGRKTLTGTVWDWFKARVHPRLESIRVDLFTPLSELKLLLPLVVASESAAQSQALIDSVRIAGAAATERGLRVDLAFDVAPRATPEAGPPAPVPTLTADELDRWHATLDSWDGFVTFVIKRAGRDSETRELQQVLAEILLEARYDLVEALRPTRPDSEDPVRPLFLKTWTRLAPALRELSLGMPGEEALRYLSLVTAGDALTALDALGPDVGFQVSADGLRRLARIVEPFALDPTEVRLEVDPDLRHLFGFGDPLPVPTQRPRPEETPIPEPILDEEFLNEEFPPDGAAPGQAPAPDGSDAQRSDATVPPQSRWNRWFWRPAYAATLDPQTLDRLYRWVPKRDEVIEYLRAVRPVLRQAARETQASKRLDPRWQTMFEPMVLATAWQETCWRQFVRKGEAVETIRSSAGALGIMQINARVWRGFYDVEALRDDISYNARAGSEILHHYLVDHAVKKKEHEAPGGVDNLPRAAYAAYNAGPGGLRRYRQGSGHRIDRKFWEKYSEVRAGNELAVARCFSVEPPAPPAQPG